MGQDDNRRILLIDDTPAIHDDFRKILVSEKSPSGMEQMEAALFGATARSALPKFELECAYQGQEGLALLRQALQADLPYAVAFVDMRMPPGWNGVQTIEHLWQADPRLQVVICTAYADQSWDEVLDRLAVGDRLLILKKPFDAVEVRQLASALSAKWNASRQAELKMAQLEKLVRVRNCQLESLNLDLLRARDAVKAASRVKSEFLANMSHEIRTPMNALLGMTHLALQTELTPRQQQYLETAKGAAESLMQTINDILDFSIMESGKLELQLSEFLLAEVLERLSAVMAEKAQLKQLQLEIDLPAGLPPLIGDHYRLGQVLINLCDNAVKFTEAGQVAVRVRVTGQSPGRITLRFSVSDTGTGIGPEQMEKLFQPFSQLDASSTRKNGGTGMGLAISRELVELMGGELFLASQAGKGSEFSFCVELGAGRSAPLPSPDTVWQQGEAPWHQLPGISVADGLCYCGDNSELYRDLLINFLETRAGSTAEIEAELARGERQSAARAAHSITSVAGTIGAKGLSEAARALEKGILAAEPEAVGRLLGQFDRQLTEVLASLKSHLGGAPAGSTALPQKGPSLEPEAVRGMLDQMTALFDCDLERALALKEQLHAELAGTIVAQEFARMERLIGNFDFEGASKSRERIDSILATAREQAPGDNLVRLREE